jgi:hypothetical protein
LTKNHKIFPYFSQEYLENPAPVRLRNGAEVKEPVVARRSRLYPGHLSLMAPCRSLQPVSKDRLEDEINLDACKFCHPETLCAESEEERTRISLEGSEIYITRTPYYSVPGHVILFASDGPHALDASTERDWRVLIKAGVETARRKPGMRLGFNAGPYLVCGSSQCHLHIQLLPIKGQTPAEEALPDGASFEEILAAYREKKLVVEEEESAFLAACWAPKFNSELVAVFSNTSRFGELRHAGLLARWIHEAAVRFAIPLNGGINGFGLESRGLPFMVRIIPRLPGAVPAFLEAGSDCMVISRPPESLPGAWHRSD